jgi:hypothetical protein
LPLPCYSFRYAGNQKPQYSGALICTHFYTFKTVNNRRYICEVHEYCHNLYVVKFFFKGHSDSKERFSFVVGGKGDLMDVYSIFNTCTNICLKILSENKLASFGIVASNRLGENQYFNTRYKIYKQRIADGFPGTKFYHITSEEKSSYLLVNRENVDPFDTTEKILNLIIENFDEFANSEIISLPDSNEEEE